jgi:hypothetical protein
VNPAELLAELRSLQVEASLNPEGRLKLCPASRVPEALLAELKAHRDEVVELLAQGPAPSEPWRADPPDVLWPDLPGSALWARLLGLAAGDADDPQGTYGRLLGARACGAVLERRGGRWRLAPVLDPTERVSVWATKADWDADAERWLRPKSREIVSLLGQLPAPEAEP